MFMTYCSMSILFNEEECNTSLHSLIPFLAYSFSVKSKIVVVILDTIPLRSLVAPINPLVPL